MARELAELEPLQPGDTTRLLDKQTFRDKKTQRVTKTARRAWLYTPRSGTCTAELRDGGGNLVQRIELELDVPGGGSRAIEMRLQVYPIRQEERL